MLTKKKKVIVWRWNAARPYSPPKPPGVSICHCSPGLRDCHGSNICDWQSHRHLLLWHATGFAHIKLPVLNWTRIISYKWDFQVPFKKKGKKKKVVTSLTKEAWDFRIYETTTQINTPKYKHTYIKRWWLSSRELNVKYEVCIPNTTVSARTGSRIGICLIFPNSKLLTLPGKLVMLACTTINTL